MTIFGIYVRFPGGTCSNLRKSSPSKHQELHFRLSFRVSKLRLLGHRFGQHHSTSATQTSWRSGGGSSMLRERWLVVGPQKRSLLVDFLSVFFQRPYVFWDPKSSSRKKPKRLVFPKVYSRYFNRVKCGC